MADHNVVFATLDAEQPWSMETYLAIDGYKAWKKILAEKTDPAEIIENVKSSALRGRGGAGFPRIQFRPFGPALVKMATEGPSDEGNATMSRSVARTKPWVLALWACLFMEAFLGVVQPWSPDQTPDETVTSGMQRDFSG